MTKKPHICIVAPAIFPIISGDRSIPVAGGAEAQQSFIARGLRQAGFPVTVVTGDFGQPDECDIDGIRVLKTSERGVRIPGIRHYHPRLTAVWRAIQRADADVYIQRCASAQTFITGLFARINRRRFIYAAASLQDLVLPQTPLLFPRDHTGVQDLFLYRIGLRLADVIVTQSAAQDEACRRYHRRTSVTIPSCYEVPRDAHADPAGPVLWVAALRRPKRVELFLELARRLPSVHFQVIGGPSVDPDALKYFSIIRDSALALPNVDFLGFLPYQDADQRFDQACLLVNTSDDREGFPNTFLQAWARGIPTVSFFDCGAREGDRPVGWLAKDLDEMVAIVRSSKADTKVLRAEGERCRKYFAEHHSVQASIDCYEKAIASLNVNVRGGGAR